jgi:hypothetical protein
MLEQTAGMNLPRQNNEIRLYIYMSSDTYIPRYSHQVRLTSFVCILIFEGHLISLLCSSPIENEETPDQRNFDACQTIRYRLRTFWMGTAFHDQTSSCVRCSKWVTMSAFFVNFDLINNKGSAVTETVKVCWKCTISVK